MYYYNNKQAQKPLYDWSCEKNWVIKMTRFCIGSMVVLNYILRINLSQSQGRDFFTSLNYNNNQLIAYDYILC